MNRTIFTVGQINGYIQSMMDGDELLSGLCIRGEISNYKVYPSGHHYFSLKDDSGSIRCVMFKSSALRLRFRPENGMRVVALGRISVFPRDGAYQLYCTGLMVDGVGDLHAAFERLKEKLMAQGLFDEENKKPIPQYPERIAIVTSPSGAAIHDMLRILRHRYPLAAVRIVPVRVQGAEAPGEIASAIRYVNHWSLADLIITGRGGGSIEDLWAFNEEIVAQAIYDSAIPVISAVGHEPDVTISDYVADLRAATPSNAAELAVQDKAALKFKLAKAQSNLRLLLERQIQSARQRLALLADSRCLRDAGKHLDRRHQELDTMYSRLCGAFEQKVTIDTAKLSRLTMALDALSPLKVLSRGFAVVSDNDGTVIRSAQQLNPGKGITVRFSDGVVCATVEAIQVNGGIDCGGK